jgi:hypothetical protein
VSPREALNVQREDKEPLFKPQFHVGTLLSQLDSYSDTDESLLNDSDFELDSLLNESFRESTSDAIDASLLDAAREIDMLVRRSDQQQFMRKHSSAFMDSRSHMTSATRTASAITDSSLSSIGLVSVNSASSHDSGMSSRDAYLRSMPSGRPAPRLSLPAPPDHVGSQQNHRKTAVSSAVSDEHRHRFMQLFGGSLL